MQNIAKKNYFVDRTYSDSVGRGKISVATKVVAQSKRGESQDGFFLESSERGQSFIRALVSFRWASYGGAVVITRQADTTDKSYELAIKFKRKMQKELLEQYRFSDNFDAFKVWVSEWCSVLEQNGFHNIKASLND